VEDGKAGYLIPIRDPLAIAEKLELLFNNRVLLTEMRQAAKSKAQSLVWSDYRRRIVEVVNSI
jgi:glycosyltransferase involved in cell wall biosynthesis